MTKVFALCGSLRADSSNRNLLLAGKLLAPSHIHFELYESLGELPHFNPDLNIEDFDAVMFLTKKVREADIILISSPEYAHGIVGSLKNALDWLVGSDAFIEKPFALWNASTRGHHAIDSLKEVLGTMSGIEVPEYGCSLHILGKDISPAEIAQIHGDSLQKCFEQGIIATK